MASEASPTTALEERYIQLLERRIAALEAKLATSEAVDADSESSNEDGEGTQPKPGKATTETEDEAKDPFENIRHLVVVNSLDQESGEYVDGPPTTIPKPAKEAAKSNRAFTFRKFMRAQPMRGEEVLRATRITQISSPFQYLVWSWEIAEGLTEPREDDSEGLKQARVDLRALMDIISVIRVAFEFLWTLFPKGSLIVSRPFFDHPQVFRVQACLIPDLNSSSPQLFVNAYSYDWDGTSFNRVRYRFAIEEYRDKKAIFELPFYPLSAHRENKNNRDSLKLPRFGDDDDDDDDNDNTTVPNDVEMLKAKLIERGKKCYEYCIARKGHQTYRYEGEAYHQSVGLFRSDSYDDSDSTSNFQQSYSGADQQISTTESTSYLRGVVVIDYKSYFEYQSRDALLGSVSKYDGPPEDCWCSECRASFEDIYKYRWDGSNSKRKTPLTDEQYMMLPPRVFAYALAQKQWVQLQVDLVKVPDIADTTNFTKKLMLNEDNKRLISGAVLAHGEDNITDYISGKGKGLVILLWGVPGVGKTLTAESVAALAGKPLFSIGVADICTDSERMEENLKNIFALAGLWQAVLLFDEADVFLEARDARGSDMQRNTMVSVLLRILEYYDGILILTTNRLKTFDIAVQSRIHIAIEYNDLNVEQRGAIFMEFLDQLHQKSLVYEYEKCEDWVKEDACTKEFNGRQIRYIVSTAMGLAHAEKPFKGLCRKHLIDVVRNTDTFKKALSDQEAVFRNAQIQARYR